MLPGFRFLLAAIVLSTSILVFGLGAAALLRAAHEQFSSIPSRRAPPETVFAQQNEASIPVLAMLQVEPPTAEKAADSVTAAAVAAEEAAIVSIPAELERTAALKPDEPLLPETATPEVAASNTSPPSETAPTQTEPPASTDETKIAAAGAALPPANETASAVPEHTSAAATPKVDAAATKIATLGGPSVTIETPPAKAAGEKADRSAAKKRRQARRAAERRRIAARAQLARQAQQPPADPFTQPTTATRSR